MQKNNSQITFKEDTHQYFNNIGEEYISCTTLIHKFVPEFDKEKWSNIVGVREGKTSEQIQKEWNKVAKDATDFGTLIHNGIEYCIKLGSAFDSTAYDNWYDELFYAVEKEFDLYKDHNTCKQIVFGYSAINLVLGSENIIPEMLLWNHKYKIAGQSDIVQINHQKNLINIIDHKTNKRIDFVSKYNEYMLSPVQHLSNCSYNTYALQLSMYAYMLQQMYPGYNIGRLCINHLDKDKGWTLYPLPYMKLEVMCMLREWEKHVKI